MGFPVPGAMYYPAPPVAAQPRVPTAVPRTPVPNSFVPTQVTRHSVQKQPRQQPAVAPVTPSKDAPREVKQETGTPSKSESAVAAPPITPVHTPERPIAAKPPGSRLAIRFNGP